MRLKTTNSVLSIQGSDLDPVHFQLFCFGACYQLSPPLTKKTSKNFSAFQHAGSYNGDLNMRQELLI